MRLFRNYILLLTIALLVGACKTQQPPALPSSHDHNRDSVRTEYRHDTIKIDRWHTQYQKGDTVFIHDSIDRWRTRHDSIDRYVYVNNTDTIYQKVQVEKPYKQFLVNSGIALWVLIALLVAGVIIGIVIKFAK